MAEKKENRGNITFGEIRGMYEGGMMGISSRTLDIAHSYKAVQFKTKLKNAYNEFDKRREQLAKEAGIEDGNEFAKRLNDLAANGKRTDAEEKEFNELVAKNERFNKLFEELVKDTCEIEPKVMPYEEWMKLQEENKDIKNGQFELLARYENVLEGILWAAPAE